MSSTYVLPNESELLGEKLSDTSFQEIDENIKSLKRKHEAWVGINEQQRAALLQECMPYVLKSATESSEVFIKYRGTTASDESRMGWIPIVLTLRHYIDNLKDSGKSKPIKRSVNINGKIVDQVLFKYILDFLFFNGKGEIVFPKGQTPIQGPKKPSGKRVGLVLGAGNHICVPFIDILSKLFFDNELVICKMNPVNEFYGPFLELALKPLVNLGFVKIVYGGAAVGKYLCNHQQIESIHLTGSDQTFNQIVWGTTNKEEIQKMEQPINKRDVSAELGCVTPCIVVPGPWSDGDILYHLKQFLGDKFLNSSHNCLSPEVLITSYDWELRGRFLDVLKKLLRNSDQKVSWYPGSDERYKQFQEKFPQAQKFGRPKQSGKLKTSPWILAEGLTPGQADLKFENWCGVMQEVALRDTEDVEKFLQEAVDLANNECWGTLSCVLLVHPTTYKKHTKVVEQAIDSLKYGCVSVNAPQSMSYIFGDLPWGAFPGNSIRNIGSGNCYMKNSRMYQNIEKGIYRGPWQSPVNFYDHHNARAMKALLQYNAYPNLWNWLQALVFMIFNL